MITDQKLGSSMEIATVSASQREMVGSRFLGKVALVTGASDRGIGGAIAERFAREGAAVAILSRQQPRKLLKLLDRLDRHVAWLQCDITESEELRQALDTIMRDMGRLDVVVNNAGVEMARRLEEHPEREWRKLLNVNLSGAIQVSQMVLPHLTQPGGVIVNVASALSIAGCSGFSIYSASKAGLVGFTQSLAWELAPKQIRVVAVSPGLVHTPMLHKHAEHWKPQARQQIEKCHPLGIGMPHDVAAAVIFLASDEARWITGVNLPLGWTSQYPLPVDPFVT